MNRKIVAVFTVIALLASLDACLPGSLTRKSRTTPDELLGINPYAATVVAVQKKSGERLTVAARMPEGLLETYIAEYIVPPGTWPS